MRELGRGLAVVETFAIRHANLPAGVVNPGQARYRGAPGLPIKPGNNPLVFVKEADYDRGIK